METKNLAKKLLEVQKKVETVLKDKKNPFYKSNYADINSYIDVVKPALNDAGVVLLQPLSGIYFQDDAGKITIAPAIITVLMDSETGEKIEHSTPIPTNTDPQKQGGIITYFRRYALQSALLLQAEDDDGNTASGKTIIQDSNDVPF